MKDQSENHNVPQKPVWAILGIIYALGFIFNLKNEHKPGFDQSTEPPEKSIEVKTTMVHATGILIAILIVWAQLWVVVGQGYEVKEESVASVGFGLLSIYVALLTAVLSFLFFIFSRGMSIAGLTLFLMTMFIAVLQVFASLVTVLLKFIADPKGVLNPNECISGFIENNAILLVVVTIFALIIAYWICRGISQKVIAKIETKSSTKTWDQ